MSPVPYRPGRSSWASLAPAAALLGVAGVLGVLIWKGVELPLFAKKAPPPIEIDKDAVLVPIAPQTIPAYKKITPYDLMNPQTGEAASRPVHPSRLSPKILLNVKDIVGRVLNHEKPAGYAFTEDDFAPKGTRPGLPGGIPKGKRGLKLDAERVEGFFGLDAQDRFDLIATYPLDPKALPDPKLSGAYGPQGLATFNLTPWKQQASVRVIAQNATIVVPVTVRASQSQQVTQGATVRPKVVQEVFVAVDPEELVKITEALAVGAQLVCAPRSGHPDADPNDRTPEHTPSSPLGGPGGPFTPVDVIDGSKRTFVPVPKSGPGSNGKGS